jgi:hypothetical protein
MNLAKNNQGEEIKIDEKRLMTERTFICSMTRYGKSYCLRKIAEQLFGKTGIIIIDPEGEYSSLREKFPFLIVGQDIPLNPDTAEFIAETTLKENLSIIIDSSSADTIDEQEFVQRFLDRFMDLELKKKKSYLVMVEEADEFAPEKGVYKSKSLRSLINLAKKGAKRGMGLILASQRPAMISKTVLSQCVNQIIGHTEWSGDLKVLQQYLRIESDTISKISEFEAGEFYLKGNFVESPQIAKINPVETAHLGGTPIVTPPTTKELEDTILKLSKSLPKLVEEKLKPSIPDIKLIENKVKDKVEKEFKSKIENLQTQLKISEKQKIPQEEIEDLIKERVEKQTDEYKGKFQEQEIKINTLQKFINSIVLKGKQILGEDRVESQDEMISESPQAPTISYNVWLDKFQGGNKKILELMIQHKRLTKSQIVIMSGYRRSHLIHNVFPTLKKAGLIKYDTENVFLIGG